MTAAPRSRVYGRFGLAHRARLGGRDLALAVLTACAFAAGGAQLTTQWLAHQLAYQPALGEPVLRTSVAPLYAPWRVFVWRGRLRGGPDARCLAERATTGLWYASILGVALGAAVLVQRRRSRRNRASELHGSARWARRDEIDRAGLFADQGVVVGRWEDRQARRLRWLRSDGPEHFLLFAPTGAGKGVGPVLSTLLSWRESLVVLDPKGENFQLSSGWRSRLSRVFRIDFTDEPAAASAFNPLAEIRIQTPRETADVQRVALQLLSPKGEGESGSEAGRYFVQAGADLLTGALLHVLYREAAKGRVATLADVAHELSDPARTHAEVLDEWLSYPHDPECKERWLDGTGCLTATHPFVATSARAQRNRDPKDRSPVLSTVVAALSLFRDPLLMAHTSRSDFRIAELVASSEPLSVYLVMRVADQERLRPLIRLLLDLWIGRLTEGTVQADGLPTRRLLFLLDEFPLLGKVPMIETALAAARGWGLKFFLVAQDYEQLVAAYGKHETLMSNCALRAAYTPNKPETARLLSSLIGSTTVRKETQSRSTTFGAFFSRRDSLSEQEVKRELLTPDECMRLPGPRRTSGERPRIVEAGDMLVFASGFSAVYAKQPLYFEDPVLFARSRLPPSLARPSDIVVPARRTPETIREPPSRALGPNAASLTTAAEIDEAILALAGLCDDGDALHDSELGDGSSADPGASGEDLDPEEAS